MAMIRKYNFFNNSIVQLLVSILNEKTSRNDITIKKFNETMI
jgi:hypothetical protein